MTEKIKKILEEVKTLYKIRKKICSKGDNHDECYDATNKLDEKVSWFKTWKGHSEECMAGHGKNHKDCKRHIPYYKNHLTITDDMNETCVKFLEGECGEPAEKLIPKSVYNYINGLEA